MDRALFELGQATDEADFDTKMQAAIAATNAYYDNVEERINLLNLSEAELADLRRDNDLDQDKAIASLTGQTNHFRDDRIKAEEDVADAATKAAEDAADAAIREAERVQAEKERIQDDIEKLRDKEIELSLIHI